MNAWRLTGPDLKDWLAGLLREGWSVVAPVERDGLRVFGPIASPDEVCLAPGQTRWSAKEFLFPRTEPLFGYTVRADAVSLRAAPPPSGPQVLFGVRACDAAGFCRLDTVFLGGPEDTLYAQRRRRTVVVSVACADAVPECFCSAVGGHPAGEEGVDVQLLPASEDWLLRALTEAGAALTVSLRDYAVASEPDWAAAREPIDRLAERLGRQPVAREWASLLERSFDLPLWDAIGMRCLGCSICNYVCPSCTCYDVQDRGTSTCGERCRSWDSCTFALFTRHSSGHNPRPTQQSRYRQRVLHKFAYFPLEHRGLLMCTGCGRCARYCPAGLSIRDTVARVVAAAEGAPAVAGEPGARVAAAQEGA